MNPLQRRPARLISDPPTVQQDSEWILILRSLLLRSLSQVVGVNRFLMDGVRCQSDEPWLVKKGVAEFARPETFKTDSIDTSHVIN